jgi:hypothetical protein
MGAKPGTFFVTGQCPGAVDDYDFVANGWKSGGW